MLTRMQNDQRVSGEGWISRENQDEEKVSPLTKSLQDLSHRMVQFETQYGGEEASRITIAHSENRYAHRGNFVETNFETTGARAGLR